MSIRSSINWLLTGLSLLMLKRSTRHRLRDEGAEWIQPPRFPRPTIVNRVDFILNYCRNKKVVHVGFTDHPFTAERLRSGNLLHTKLEQVTSELLGLDVDNDSITQYRALVNDANVFQADINSHYPTEATEFKPALILISEVLEHLPDPHQAIHSLYTSFEAGTEILVTVPNYTAMDNLAASLHKTESIHPHHYWYFSPYTLSRLLDDDRFELKQLHFGMYYQPNTRINAIMKAFPFNGDCIIGVFSIIKPI